MMKIGMLRVLFLCGWSLWGWATGDGNQIVGQWYSEDRNQKYEVFQSGATYSARLIWMAEPNHPDGSPKLDENNPDPAKRRQPLVGMTVFWGLTYRNGSWVNGKTYSPRQGRTADCSVRLRSNNELELTGSVGFVKRSRIWKRA
ncbi:DUF2147 domain-containing protein [Fibrisoma montanum]|uniref:DUF2147 domain-containing protein n=1 Tax=Fibrisoma montanum TaxID=2305895 RepID=A0A418MC88_9BACT|nr:DUF2147 domain-containing protein [Fibrisoma montanum]RIV23936.1 DUF2147 domain-containing protein [Fibrisoma montanum]